MNILKSGTYLCTWNYIYEIYNSTSGLCLEMEMSADPTHLYFLSPAPAPMVTWLESARGLQLCGERQREGDQHFSPRSQLCTTDLSRQKQD